MRTLSTSCLVFEVCLSKLARLSHRHRHCHTSHGHPAIDIAPHPIIKLPLPCLTLCSWIWRIALTIHVRLFNQISSLASSLWSAVPHQSLQPKLLNTAHPYMLWPTPTFPLCKGSLLPCRYVVFIMFITVLGVCFYARVHCGYYHRSGQLPYAAQYALS